jgi:hypothetical protein
LPAVPWLLFICPSVRNLFNHELLVVVLQQSELSKKHEIQQANTRFTAHVRAAEDKMREMAKRADDTEDRLQVQCSRTY